MHYAFSSAYSIDPITATTEPYVIPAKPGDIEGENNIYQWYCPAAEDTSDPSRKVKWNESTKSPEIDQSKKLIDFQLGMNLLYFCGNKENETVVYEGASADGLLHTIPLKEKIISVSMTATSNNYINPIFRTCQILHWTIGKR